MPTVFRRMSLPLKCDDEPTGRVWVYTEAMSLNDSTVSLTWVLLLCDAAEVSETKRFFGRLPFLLIVKCREL